MPKKIYLFTSCFPYYPGEQFIENEVQYLSSRNDVDLTIFPLNTGKTCRSVPNNIKVDISLSTQPSCLEQIKFLLLSLLSPELYLIAYRDDSLNYKLPFTILSYSRFLFYKEKLAKNLKRIDGDIILYTYWHNEFSYAIQQKFNKNKVLSRIHGYDIYENRKRFNYMPMKRSFINNIKIHALSDSAKEYLVKTYNFNSNNIYISRLGVRNLNICCTPSEKESEFHLVSCSFLVRVKRIDKIIDALHEVAKKNRTLKIKWTHIGSGVLQEELLHYSKKLSGLIDYSFIGELTNQQVYDFYSTNKIDAFINTSESEGVPVSIMEAMSCHIPVIAPDVGGIHDIVVNNYNGILLSSKSSINEIILSLTHINFFKSTETRQNARNTFLEKFDAERNYADFYNSL